MKDGAYESDPREAIAYLRDKVLSKKLLGGSGIEYRPADPALGMQ